jgi:hypothetical protein
MKKILSVLIFLLAVSCFSNLFAQDKLAGTWERRGDDYEGMQIKVTKTKDGTYRGKIVAWPVKINDPCWRMGEIKWRNIQPTVRNLYQMDELLRDQWDCSTSTQSKYIDLTSEGKISITPIFSDSDTGSNYQTWVKISD